MRLFDSSNKDAYIIRAHSFLRKIFLNSAGRFANFRGLSQQNCPNFAAFWLGVN